MAKQKFGPVKNPGSVFTRPKATQMQPAKIQVSKKKPTLQELKAKAAKNPAKGKVMMQPSSIQVTPKKVEAPKKSKTMYETYKDTTGLDFKRGTAPKKTAATKKATAPAKKETMYETYKKTTGLDFKKSNPKKEAPKKQNKVQTDAPKPTTETVRKLWTDKTGMAWSEAKNLGLSDGSLNSNLSLMKKLKSGSITKDSVKEMKTRKDIAFVEPKVTQDNKEPYPMMRRGGVKAALTGATTGIKSANVAKVEANRKKVADNKAKVEANRKKVTTTKSTGPTVSQLWTEKTGLAWSEAKKRGLSDGSLNSNLALMKKLKSGEVSKNSLEPKASTTSATEEIPQGLGKVSVESRLSEMEPKPKLAQIRTEYSAPKKPQTRKEIRQENRRMRKMKRGGTYKSVNKKRK